ncbi:MAG: thioredoxin family protein [Kiritimatiellae bacterium]|jgi:thiol-disulfide isomerase/thioredoxin|nr:thioredoxin family protein [Kiritimatiellia bacterium]
MKNNKKTIIPFLLSLLISVSAIRAEEKTFDKTASRTWTSKKGDAIEASFEKNQYGLVYLKKADGKTIKVRGSALCEEDQKLLASFNESAITKALNSKKGQSVKKAPKEIYALFGEKLRTSRNKPVSVDTLSDKVIGVYFSAHWCPPCRKFTPELVKFYDSLKAEGKPFEIIFVSSDRSEDAMYEYMKEMDMKWLALPFGDKRKAELANTFNVKGIPKFVVINSKGELITENGRGEVPRGTKVFENWEK